MVPSLQTAGKGSGGSDPNAGRLKDFVDSYLRQLYGGSTATRMLAAQGLGALPSFLPPGGAAEALRLAVELGVVGSLTDVLAADDELPVQEACLMAVASLLLATSPYEDHGAPLKPQHLKLLGATVVRHDVMAQIGYLLTATANSRVVLAAARVMAICAPYITQSNDLYVLDSRIVPALLSAAAARPDPGGRGTGGDGGGASTPRDAAACVLALLTLAQTTRDLYVAVCTADFLQAVSVLYERCIDPDQPSDVVLPADAAALLLRAATLTPNPRAAAKLPGGHARILERNIEESDVLECLVSYLAVEAANLRRLGEELAAAAAGNAEAVIDRNGLELDCLQAEVRERRQRLAEARVEAQNAWRRVQAAEEEAARAQGEVKAVAAAPAGSRRGGGGTQEQRRARREAEAEAAAAEAEAEGRRRGAEAAEAAMEVLADEVTAIRRAAAHLRWLRERMMRLAAKMQSWRGTYGFKSRSKVKLSRPNTAMLTQVLAFLSERVKPPPAPERGAPSARGAGSPSPSPSPSPVSDEHVAALQARLLDAGLVQAVLQLFTVLSGVQSLVEDLAALGGELALQPDMAAALKVAAEQLGREAEGLAGINWRAERRLGQVRAEAARLRKALRLELPLPEGSPRARGWGWGGAAELGPANGLSRTVLQEDVKQRLEDLESEAGDLTAALGDSEALVEFLRDRVQAVTAASSALADSHAVFLKAFPAQALTAQAAPAPSASTASPSAAANGHANGNGNGHATNGNNDSEELRHSRALRLASSCIMTKDHAHPAGHLLGLLSRALAPVTRGSQLNLPALVRQLLGRPPDGAAGVAASWPPSPAKLSEAAAAGAGSGSGSRSGSVGRSRSNSTGSAMLAAGRPRSASAIVPGQGSTSLSASYVGGVSAAAAAAARPGSARYIGGGPSAERPYTSGSLSPRVSGLYGSGSGALGGGFLGAGGPFPADAKCPPTANPRFALLLREKSAAAAAGGAAAPPARVSVGRTPVETTASAPLDIWASASMPLAEESRRVVHQVVSSVLFDPVNADVLGPGYLAMQRQQQQQQQSRASLAAGPGSLTLLADGGLGSRRQSAAYGSRASAAALVKAPTAQAPTGAEAELSAAEAVGGGGGGDGDGDGDMSVLDALLLQSELLCGVMEALAALQQFAKSTSRTCRQLPASLSFASLQPGSLGPYMARLHGMWTGAIPRFPDVRVQIADSVAEIAHLALVPGTDFAAVYRDSGMLEALVQMLAGGTRPGGGGKAGGKSGAGGSAAAAAAAASSPRSRYVGRLSATAPPTLRVGAAQQAEQAAAGQALRAISQAQSEVLVSIGQDEKLLTRLSALVLDHSMSWPARQSAADLLGDLVLGGGPGAEAAVAAGAYAGLVEMVNRDMYPFLNQDPRGSKETVVAALACLVAHPELLEGVVAAAQASHGPSAGLPLSGSSQVMSAILRSLWGVCWQVYTTYISARTGHGRHVDPELVSALTATAATAARELAVLADTVPEARRALIMELGLRSKISTTFLEAIKDPLLYEALVELRKNLS